MFRRLFGGVTSRDIDNDNARAVDSALRLEEQQREEKQYTPLPPTRTPTTAARRMRKISNLPTIDGIVQWFLFHKEQLKPDPNNHNFITVDKEKGICGNDGQILNTDERQKVITLINENITTIREKAPDVNWYYFKNDMEDFDIYTGLTEQNETVYEEKTNTILNEKEFVYDETALEHIYTLEDTQVNKKDTSPKCYNPATGGNIPIHDWLSQDTYNFVTRLENHDQWIAQTYPKNNDKATRISYPCMYNDSQKDFTYIQLLKLQPYNLHIVYDKEFIDYNYKRIVVKDTGKVVCAVISYGVAEGQSGFVSADHCNHIYPVKIYRPVFIDDNENKTEKYIKDDLMYNIDPYLYKEGDRHNCWDPKYILTRVQELGYIPNSQRLEYIKNKNIPEPVAQHIKLRTRILDLRKMFIYSSPQPFFNYDKENIVINTFGESLDITDKERETSNYITSIKQKTLPMLKKIHFILQNGSYKKKYQHKLIILKLDKYLAELAMLESDEFTEDDKKRELGFFDIAIDATAKIITKNQEINKLGKELNGVKLNLNKTSRERRQMGWRDARKHKNTPEYKTKYKKLTEEITSLHNKKLAMESKRKFLRTEVYYLLKTLRNASSDPDDIIGGSLPSNGEHIVPNIFLSAIPVLRSCAPYVCGILLIIVLMIVLYHIKKELKRTTSSKLWVS